MQVCGAAKMMFERCGVPTEKRMEPTMPMTRNVTLCVLQQNVHLKYRTSGAKCHCVDCMHVCRAIVCGSKGEHGRQGIKLTRRCR